MEETTIAIIPGRWRTKGQEHDETFQGYGDAQHPGFSSGTTEKELSLQLAPDSTRCMSALTELHSPQLITKNTLDTAKCTLGGKITHNWEPQPYILKEFWVTQCIYQN